MRGDVRAMRKAAQRDGNEAEIVAALRAAGYHVTHLNDPAVPDLLVIRPSDDIPVFVASDAETALSVAMPFRVTLIEVKQPGKPLRPLQLKWHNEVKGHEPTPTDT